MPISIRSAAVIGSGTMGSGIAALLAGAGVDTHLLDLPARDTRPGDPSDARNAIVLANLERLAQARPPQLSSEDDLRRIHPGNTEDNFDRLAGVDWVVEVVVERLDVKRDLMQRLNAVVRPNTIISTNTSGLPIRAIAEGLGKGFTRRFLGTHFFNPPRYLRLVEVIPHPNADPGIVSAMVHFLTNTLDKGVVICEDKPNFIGNRFLTIIGMHTVNSALDQGLSVAEVDTLTGPLIGRPRTATFRLMDLIGIDIMVDIARNLYPAIPDDPARAVLEHERSTALFKALLERGWLGNKSGQGFYKTVKDAEGNKTFWTLNLDTLDYDPPSSAQLGIVTEYGSIENTGERIRRLLSGDDKLSKFLWYHHAFYLAYASQRVPEITDSIVNIDNAQKWGFGHELGPFEIWDALGVAETVQRFEAANCPVADWVKQMVSTNHPTFYHRDEAGNAVACYSLQSGRYEPLVG